MARRSACKRRIEQNLMMMKTFLNLCGLALFFAAGVTSTQAATARNYPDALEMAKDNKAIIAFCYGANYDKISEAKHKEFVKGRKLLRGLGSQVFIEIPIYQMPDKKERRERDKIMGGKNLPGGIYSYPSIAIISGDGTLRAVIQSSEEMKDLETAKKHLDECIEQFKAQQKILTRIDGTKSSKLAERLVEAADIGLTIPSHYTKQLEGSKDDKGYGKRFSFSWEPLLVEMDKQEGYGDAIRYIRGIMDGGIYTKIQRQELLAVLTGHLRRSGAPRGMLLALYYEMHAIDPDSAYGSYALEAIRIWLTFSPE